MFKIDMNNLSNLTVIIVTYKTNKDILKNCLDSIDSNVKIKIIENSTEFEDYNFFITEYQNLKIECTKKNLGYGGGNNYGFRISETNFVLVVNPDIVFDKSFFENIKKYLDEKLDFSIIGTSYKNDKIFNSCGFFKESEKKNFDQIINSKTNNQYSFLKKVDWVTGCTMLINLKKFKDKKLFDENFFLYCEEFDLCKQIEINNGNVYSSEDLYVDHLGYKGSFGADPELKYEAEKLREWHWMWSSFYFYKKNYGYHYAFKKHIGKLLRTFIKTLFFTVTLNKASNNKYRSRLSGLWNSMIGKKSWYRVNSKFQ